MWPLFGRGLSIWAWSEYVGVDSTYIRCVGVVCLGVVCCVGGVGLSGCGLFEEVFLLWGVIGLILSV